MRGIFSDFYEFQTHITLIRSQISHIEYKHNTTHTHTANEWMEQEKNANIYKDPFAISMRPYPLLFN